ncbi:hypothetical protein BN873_330076 [Candidatus Competibacter denitrificans Run_A_D11]|uniref:Uncharacterized protein n=1 Tax=Candidatus Competibacter denitrificans Run_A_D11 TaxID=1400863 RepID=W6M7N5_9GAMM|nr:hypothetical protein BN873_330076 [Candidatus Competibacter denitrificans Run_A_D11]
MALLGTGLTALRILRGTIRPTLLGTGLALIVRRRAIWLALRTGLIGLSQG